MTCEPWMPAAPSCCQFSPPTVPRAQQLGTNQLLLGNGLEGAAEKVRAKLPTAWAMAASFYPPVLIMINRMPLADRMYVLGPAGVLFNTAVAYLAAQRKSEAMNEAALAAASTASVAMDVEVAPPATTALGGVSSALSRKFTERPACVGAAAVR